MAIRRKPPRSLFGVGRFHDHTIRTRNSEYRINQDGRLLKRDEKGQFRNEGLLTHVGFTDKTTKELGATIDGLQARSLEEVLAGLRQGNHLSEDWSESNPLPVVFFEDGSSKILSRSKSPQPITQRMPVAETRSREPASAVGKSFISRIGSSISSTMGLKTSWDPAKMWGLDVPLTNKASLRLMDHPKLGQRLVEVDLMGRKYKDLGAPVNLGLVPTYHEIPKGEPADVFGHLAESKVLMPFTPKPGSGKRLVVLVKKDGEHKLIQTDEIQTGGALVSSPLMKQEEEAGGFEFV